MFTVEPSCPVNGLGEVVPAPVGETLTGIVILYTDHLAVKVILAVGAKVYVSELETLVVPLYHPSNLYPFFLVAVTVAFLPCSIV